MESKGIFLTIFSPPKGGFGVAVSRISGDALTVLRPYIHDCPDNVDKVFTKSERLKHTETMEAAQAYVQRFYSLTLEDQIAIIANKSLRYRADKVKVITNVQYYELVLNRKSLGTTYRLDEIANLRKLYPTLHLRKSSVREMAFEKQDFELNKHRITCLPAKPKGRIKTDILTQFKGIVTKRK